MVVVVVGEWERHGERHGEWNGGFGVPFEWSFECLSVERFTHTRWLRLLLRLLLLVRLLLRLLLRLRLVVARVHYISQEIKSAAIVATEAVQNAPVAWMAPESWGEGVWPKS